MRTTVRLPDSLMRAAKRHAERTGRTLTQLLADCLHAELQAGSKPARAAEALPTYRGVGLRPGVDISDSNALEDLMDGR